ncbi:MAG: histidine kinase [Gemmatimonadaceae bacterium]|nr:histidine kinase [Chitinophagaceae bacterium]
MSSIIDKTKGPLYEFFGKRTYLILSLLLSIPVWLAINLYVRNLDIHEDEAVSVAITTFFIMSIFAGRHIARLYLGGERKNFTVVNTSLLLAIVASIAFIFFHADFPLGQRRGINVFLFFFSLLIIGLAFGMLFKILRHISARQLNEARSDAAHSESELHLLQSQLSPHFLFNTLNNLYGLSISQHEKLPPLLLKLSELLRYSVYESSQPFVPLKEEIAYLKNYIEFEKIRIGERLVLTSEMDDILTSEIRIAPMLLIVFVENAFKHSKNSPEEKIFIDLKLKIWGSSILFSIMNSHQKSSLQTTMPGKDSGFGLDNVQKRLKLLYPDDYKLEIQNEDTIFNVMLLLKAK